MDYESYRKSYFADPAPEPRFGFSGIYGATLFFEAYEEVVDFYGRVLGPPTYVEGDSTKGWRVGDTWLTLLRGAQGSPQNVEILFVMASPAEAEKLQAAFIDAGGVGDSPADTLMYEPVRACPVKDPFGTEILIIGRL